MVPKEPKPSSKKGTTSQKRTPKKVTDAAAEDSDSDSINLREEEDHTEPMIYNGGFREEEKKLFLSSPPTPSCEPIRYLAETEIPRVRDPIDNVLLIKPTSELFGHVEELFQKAADEYKAIKDGGFKDRAIDGATLHEHVW